jgi:hypothetical protein
VTATKNLLVEMMKGKMMSLQRQIQQLSFKTWNFKSRCFNRCKPMELQNNFSNYSNKRCKKGIMEMDNMRMTMKRMLISIFLKNSKNFKVKEAVQTNNNNRHITINFKMMRITKTMKMMKMEMVKVTICSSTWNNLMNQTDRCSLSIFVRNTIRILISSISLKNSLKTTSTNTLPLTKATNQPKAGTLTPRRWSLKTLPQTRSWAVGSKSRMSSSRTRKRSKRTTKREPSTSNLLSSRIKSSNCKCNSTCNSR